MRCTCIGGGTKSGLAPPLKKAAGVRSGTAAGPKGVGSCKEGHPSKKPAVVVARSRASASSRSFSSCCARPVVRALHTTNDRLLCYPQSSV